MQLVFLVFLFPCTIFHFVDFCYFFFLSSFSILMQLPQQENLSDCGLFLLHYAERFLEEAPVNFSPFKITELSNFVSDPILFSSYPKLKIYMLCVSKTCTH